MEELIDAVTAITPDNAGVMCLSVLLNDVSRFSEEHSRLDDSDGLVKTLSCCLNDADCIGIGLRLLADIICLVQVAVEALVVQSNIDIDDIAILQGALVGDTVADDLVNGSADGLGEIDVVKGRGIRL